MRKSLSIVAVLSLQSLATACADTSQQSGSYYEPPHYPASPYQDTAYYSPEQLGQLSPSSYGTQYSYRQPTINQEDEFTEQEERYNPPSESVSMLDWYY